MGVTRAAAWFVVGALAVDAGCGGRTGLNAGRAERVGVGAPGGVGSAGAGGSAPAGGTISGRGGSVVGGSAGSGGVGGSVSQGGSGGAAGRGGAAGVAGQIAAGGIAGSAGASASAGAAGSAGSSGTAGTAGIGGEGGEGGEAGNPDATALGLGAFHTCAAFADGSMRCWGTAGYIGSGSEVTIGDDEPASAVPVVEMGGDVRRIAAGWYHTCAIMASGSVRCFGVAADGRLGYANAEDIGDDETPASAGDVDIGAPVVRVSVGPSHTCALLTTAAVRCWGSNNGYQLGYPSLATIGDDEAPATAGDLDLGGPVIQVVVGGNHSCALLEGGTVRCWGTGSGGRLGYGNVETIGDDESPREAGDVDVGGDVVSLAAGLLHTCALLATGNVRCWGPGTYGVLGYGNQDPIGDDETPAQAGDVDVGGTVLQIAAGDFATCALLDGGSVRCWGRAIEGELGYGNLDDIGDDETPASAGDVPLGAPATHIDVGFLHTCAILQSGAVRCWGRAETGALGYGSVDINDIGDDETPASAGDVPMWPDP
jgi:alpha-tubulin suppressor-like RCC1 family protein